MSEFLKTQSEKKRELLFMAISSLVKGENLETKREFLDFDGI